MKNKFLFLLLLQNMTTWLNIQRTFQQELSEIYSPKEAAEIFFILLEDAFGLSKTSYLTNQNEPLDSKTHNSLTKAIEQLKKGRPIQHITGKAYFYGQFFEVNENTLIPRVETEELVVEIIKDHNKLAPISILDIGTGSGCIAISLKLYFEKATVKAIDISAAALAVAQRNSDSLGAEVEFEVIDILSQESHSAATPLLDVIVSNPPYVRELEKSEMHKNVLQFEPASALFVDDQKPLVFYEAIAKYAKGHLKKNGTLYFEINQYLASETKQMLLDAGFSQISVINDLYANERIIKCKLA